MVIDKNVSLGLISVQIILTLVSMNIFSTNYLGISKLLIIMHYYNVYLLFANVTVDALVFRPYEHLDAR